VTAAIQIAAPADATLSDDDFRMDVRAFLAEKAPMSCKARVAEGVRLEPLEYRNWQKILHRRGWGAPLWPMEYGGPGWSAARLYIFEEEAARAHAPGQYHQGLNLIGPILMAYGSAAQRARYLPRILSADDWWCQGYSESAAGSDLAALKSMAVRDGDGWVVSGQKLWTSYAHVATHMFCLVRTSAAARKQDGLSLLLIPTGRPGVSIRPIITIDGRHHTNEVFLDRVRVSSDALVGEAGRGWSYGKALLRRERALAMSNGLRLVEHLAAVKSRLGRGDLGSDLAPLRGRLASLEVEITALTGLIMRALADEAGGAPAGPISSLLKLRWSELLQAVTECGLQAPTSLEGHAPASNENLSTHSYFYNRSTSIYGGTSEIQRDLVARSLLSRAS
jgi:alkylation response protein AidB-like acyl-CoA dehydrogenase